MLKKKIIVANWKMNPGKVGDAIKLIKDIKIGLKKIKKVSQIIICPPFPFLSEVKKNVSGNKNIILGAQDCFYMEKGAYTGEISPSMLTSLGVKYVIIGHLEKRRLGETDEIINKKIKFLLKNGLRVVLCIGEKERDSTGECLKEIKRQLSIYLEGVKGALFKNILIAYEPEPALSGSSESRCYTPCETKEMVLFIKKILVDIAGRDNGLIVPILYGGSVDNKNCLELAKDGGIDGFTIGRASLNSNKFLEIIKLVS